MNIKDNLTQLIGDTPLMYLSNVQNARVAVKLEYFNPLGSVKDRAAFAMIADAEKRGALSPARLLSSRPPAIPVLGWRLSALRADTGLC